MINYLSVEKVSKSFGENILFSDLSFGLGKGQRMAIVARNGAGKTTMLRIIAGKETADEGQVIFRNDIRTGYLEQDPQLDSNATVIEALFASDTPVLKATRLYYEQLENNEPTNRLQEALDEMERLKAWDTEAHAKQVLSQLAIHNVHQKVGTLSGGQRKRVALARLLIEEPDILIMDEPTNHLDLEMIEWMEGFLTRQTFTLLMVTHDRYFLDRVCNEIIELEDNTLYRYKGNYSYYLEKKDEREATKASEVSKAQNLMRKELEWMRRQPKARGTKSKARIDAFYDLKDKAKKKKGPGDLELEISTTRLGSKVLELHKLKKSYGELLLLDGFSYKFRQGEKVGIIGKNGVGKSTLLKIIMDEEEPDGGKVVHGTTVVFGHYSQDGLQLKESKRVIEVVKDSAEYIPLAKGKKLSASQLLERFLFSKEKQYSYVSKLSGGEKRRLYLLTILIANPNFLILDEPTNDLDVMTLSILEDFLRDFPGCLLVVSHDRFFMDKTVDHVFVFEGNGKVKDFPGNYSQYRSSVKSLPQSQSLSNTPKERKEETPKEPQGKKRLSYKEKREFEQLGKDIDGMEKRKEEILNLLNSTEQDHEKIDELSKELSQLTTELGEKEDRWLELSEYA